MVMQAFSFDIEYYITDLGKKPFKEWVDSLRDIKGRAKVRVRLDRARLGNLGDYKQVESGVYEMRIDFGPGYRVYFAKEGNCLLLLLIGGDKRTQRMDIKTAVTYWQDHQERCKK